MSAFFIYHYESKRNKLTLNLTKDYSKSETVPQGVKSKQKRKLQFAFINFKAKNIVIIFHNFLQRLLLVI